MIKRNRGKNLRKMVAAIKYRQSTLTGAGCAYTRMTGNVSRIGLPTIAPKISEEENKQCPER